MRMAYLLLALALTTLTGCEWHLADGGKGNGEVKVSRYDRIESLYLTTGDFSALQQMNINYPIQTRTLIEDVLRIGRVNDPQINTKFLRFYQDTTLQRIVGEAEQQYANMDDINRNLTAAFARLRKELPGVEAPEIYAQIGSLDQSIVVGNNTLGISLDKYLGANYPIYKLYYPAHQRRQMVRSMIVPDCLLFYLLSLYPMDSECEASQAECDLHIGKIQWMVNRVTGKRTFRNEYVDMADRYMKSHKEATFDMLMARPL